MFSVYQDHFDWRAQALLAGRYEDLAKHYAVPMDLKLAGRPLHIASSDAMALQLRRLHMALMDHKVTGLSVRVLAVELPSDIHRVWLEWRAHGAPDLNDASSVAVYRIQRQDGWIRVVEATFMSLLVPRFAEQRFQRRLAKSRNR